MPASRKPEHRTQPTGKGYGRMDLFAVILTALGMRIAIWIHDSVGLVVAFAGVTLAFKSYLISLPPKKEERRPYDDWW